MGFIFTELSQAFLLADPLAVSSIFSRFHELASKDLARIEPLTIYLSCSNYPIIIPTARNYLVSLNEHQSVSQEAALLLSIDSSASGRL